MSRIRMGDLRRRLRRWSVLMVTAAIGQGASIERQMPMAPEWSGPAAARAASVEPQRRIPFRLIRNKVILPVRVNASRELQVILDTGMPYDGLLLYKRELRDSIGVGTFADARVGGAGAGAAASAVVADSVSFSVGDVTFDHQRVIVLQNDLFAGFPTDGVTGYSLFGHFAVEIDYDAELITLHEPGTRPPDDSWRRIPIAFRQNRIPWVEAVIDLEGNRRIPVSLYIDLASGEALELLIRDDMKFALPAGLEEYLLGRGLSGDVRGYRGRVVSLDLGPFSLRDVTTAFAPAAVRSRQPGADGVLSNNAVRRFNVIFDYQNEALYLKPNGHYREPFD